MVQHQGSVLCCSVLCSKITSLLNLIWPTSPFCAIYTPLTYTPGTFWNGGRKPEPPDRHLGTCSDRFGNWLTMHSTRGVRNKSKMKEIINGAQNGFECDHELKAEGHDNPPVAGAKEPSDQHFKEGISPITSEHAPFQRPRIVEEMYSLSCKKPCTKIMGSPAGNRPVAQSDSLTGGPGAIVSADSGEAPSPLVLDENEDLDDSLLELEENEIAEDEYLMNLTSEEIDEILQESDDDIIDNSGSLRLGDVSGKGGNELHEDKSSDNILLSLSPPNESQLPKHYLIIDELETNYLGDVLSTDDTVLKVEEETNRSLKSEELNQNSLNEIAEIEKSEQPYLSVDQYAYLSVDEYSVIKPEEGSSSEETVEGDHTARTREADAGTQIHMTGSSPNMLKKGDLLMREQDVSEEKADDGRVKENVRIPGSGKDEVHNLKEASKNEQPVEESAEEKRPQEPKPVKAVRRHSEIKFNTEREQKKRLYLQRVSNHMKEGHQNQVSLSAGKSCFPAWQSWFLWS
ncbi:S100P-binding protein-like isoform X3 [Narcine bancroftii]|uniref:S100P-binding protein-like isoform X3 n=1 Tax=Narcine bancroftii TaxID=1343680 RepID=UPI00383166FE